MNVDFFDNIGLDNIIVSYRYREYEPDVTIIVYRDPITSIEHNRASLIMPHA